MICGNCGVQLLTEYCLAPACETYVASMRKLKERRADDELYRRSRLAALINYLNQNKA